MGDGRSAAPRRAMIVSADIGEGHNGPQMFPVIAVVLSVTAAFSFGLSSVIEQRSTKLVPDRGPFSPRLLVDHGYNASPRLPRDAHRLAPPLRPAGR